MIETLRFAGAEWVCAEICRRLDRERYHPLLLTYREGDDLAEMLRRSGVEWSYAPRSGRCDLSHIRALLDLVDRERVELLHTHLYGASGWGEIARRARPDLLHVSHVHQMSTPRWSLNGFLNRLVVSRSDLVVAVCEGARRELLERHGLPASRVVTVYNGVDLERFRPAITAERSAARRSLGLPEGFLVIGMVASLGPVKHHENLLRAAKLLQERQPVSVAIAGTGDKHRQELLKQLAGELGLSERVHFLGRRSDIPAVLAAFDIGVLSSRLEAMPLAVLEYMACGLPIVCTAVGGVQEMLGDPPVGMLVRREDPAALAAGLEALLADAGARRSLGERARRRAEEQFDIRKMVRRIEELYDDLLAAHASRWV